jgi:ribose transport system permease protein
MVALGSIFLLVITDAMDLLNVDTRLQTIFLGVILIFAVALDELGRRRRAHVRR